METKAEHWYWAWYEQRLACIQAAADNSGFFSHGQEELHQWDEAILIEEISINPSVD